MEATIKIISLAVYLFLVNQLKAQIYDVNFGNAAKSTVPSNWNCIDTKNGAKQVKSIKNHPYTGQIHVIKFHPCYDGQKNRVVYAGSPFGGLFVSEDDGENWVNLNTDTQLPTVSVTDMEISEEFTSSLYIATGRGQGNANHFEMGAFNKTPQPLSAGVFYSDDAGTNWKPLNSGLENYISKGFRIGKIRLNQRTQELLISTNFGIFKYDGNSWKLVFDSQSETDLLGLEFQPGSSYQTVYCSGSTHLYKSTDGGDSWSADLSFPANFKQLFANKYQADVPSVPNLILRSDIAFGNGSGQDPNVFYVYLLADFKFNSKSGYILYRHDAGNIWTFLDTDTAGMGTRSSYAPDRISLVVDPNDENTVYYGHTKVRRTNYQSGTTPQTATSTYGDDAEGLHADHHALAIHPIYSLRLWNGNDGGVSTIDRNFSNVHFSVGTDALWKARNNGLQVQKIWTFDESEFDEDSYILGYQDNGTNYHEYEGWARVGNGDGYGEAIDDYGRENRIYFSSHDTHFFSNDYPEVGSYNNATNFAIYDAQQTKLVKQDRSTDVLVHPITGEVYLSGNNELFTRNGNVFTTATVSAWTNPYFGMYTDPSGQSKPRTNGESRWAFSSDGNYTYVLDRNYATFDNLDPAFFENNGDILIPQFSYSSNGDLSDFPYKDLYSSSIPSYCGGDCYHATSSDIAEGDASNMVPEKPVTGFSAAERAKIIAENHIFNVDALLFMSFAGFHAEYKVWAYSPRLEQWRNMDPNYSLPNLPVYSIAYDRMSGLLFAGTEVGVYVFNPDVNRWEKYGDIPNVRVVELKVNKTFRKLRAATFGRGLWETELPSSCSPLLIHTAPISGWTNSYTAEEIRSSSTVNQNVLLSYSAGDMVSFLEGFSASADNNTRVFARTTDYNCASSYPVHTRPIVTISVSSCKTTPDKSKLTQNEDEVSEETVYVYPNPTTAVLYISPLNEQIYSVTVRDIKGNLIQEYHNVKGRTELDTNPWSKGVYFVEIKGKHNSITKKVVKQ